jgi:vacuolar-type H+-ATPase subunit I/STV1
MTDNNVDLRVDVGVLKSQIQTITSLCQKMDLVIEKIVNQQDRYISQIYQDMENRRQEKNIELKEVHDRIDTVIDKVQLTEMRIKEEISQLREEISKNSRREQESIEKLNQWRWMVGGAIIVISWLLSHGDFDTILKLID